MAEMVAATWAFVKAAFVAVGSGTATAGQVATVLAVNVAGSVALTAAASALMKPNVGGRAPGEWLADPNAGIPFAIGDRIGVAGNIVYKNTYGKDNDNKSIVTVVSGAGPVSAYLGFTADREPVVFNGESATGRYAGQMYMQRRLGEQPDVALTSPAALPHKLPDWGPNHRLSGKAAFMWTLCMDSKFSTFPQGEPAPITILRGIKGYDHRYDDTMPGGSGPCRLNDRSTYRTITNPIIADLNWCLGLRENGKVVGGLGASPEGIDWAAYTRAANVADANGWKVTAYPRSDEPKSEVRAGFLQAGGAVISRRAGLISCVTRGAPKAPVMTISAADTAGPIELDTAANVLNRYNTIVPRYLSEAHQWQLTPAAPVSSAVYVEEDRGRLSSDQRDYPYVASAKQAAELAALDIAHSREGIAGRWPLKPYCRDIEPGDVFTVTEPGLLLDGMDMLALQREYDPATDTVYVVFVSETPGKVAWALGQQANPSPTPALSARHDLSAPDPGAWDVVIVPPTAGGVSTPGAEVVIDIDNARAEDLVVEIGPSADGPWRVVKTVTIIDGQLRVPVNELTPGEVFWVAMSYRSVDEGSSPKTVKGPFTAGQLIANDATHLDGEPTSLVLDKLTSTAELADQNRQAVEALEDAYGPTVNAAVSAAAAAASEAEANQAKAEAILAAAQTDQRAQDAEEARLEAQQARAGAVSARNESVAAAEESEDAAAVATQERQLATQARNESQAGAAAAVEARDEAASWASESDAGAAASQAAKLEAQAARDGARNAAIAGLPDTISSTLWALASALGAPSVRADLPAAYVVNGIYKPPVGLYAPAGPKAFVAWQAGRIYEVTMTVVGGGADAYARFVVERRDAAYATRLAGTGSTTPIAVTAGQTVTITRRFGMGAAVAGGTNLGQLDAAWIGFAAHVNTASNAASTVAGANQAVTAFTIRDVTAQVASETAAQASASSAVSAAASDAAAGQKAAAAHEDMLAAQTARGGAQAAETGAVQAAEDSEGHAASASAASQLTAQYRDQSQTAAQASNEAAGIATTKADQAGVHAQAADAAKLAAQAARGGAVGAAVATLPRRPAQQEFFTSSIVGRPESVGPVTSTGVSVTTDPEEGDVLRTTGVARHVNTRGWVAIGEGRTHRVTARVRLVADGGLPTKVQIGIRRTNAAADNNGGMYVTQTMSVAAGWQTITWEATSASIRSGQPSATHFRPGSYLGSETGSSNPSGGSVEIASLAYEDVTSEAAGSAAASASVLAAAKAEAFADDAEDAAAASEGAAVQAAARAGEGLAYRNQAVDARDGAVAANVASGTSAQAALAAVRDSGVIPPFTSKSNIQRYWSHQFAGASETLADLLDANIENVAEGWALKINASTDFLRPKWASTPVAGQKVRVTVKCRKPSAAANSLQIITRGQSAAGAAIGANVTTSVALTGTNSQTVSAVMDMDAWVAQGAASVMFRLSASAAGVIYVTAVQIEDVTAEQAAEAHAATALTQASSAGDASAEAKMSANLAAQVGGGSLNPNPAMTAWAGSEASGPDNWTVAGGANGALSKGPGANGLPHSLRTASSSTADFGVNSATFAGAFGGEWLALTIEFTLVSGDLRGAGASIHRRKNGLWVSSANLNLATEKDAAGNIAGSGVVGRRYSFTKLLDGRGIEINGYSVLGWARHSSFSPVGAATVDWHRLSVRTATAEEVAAGTVLPVVEAQLAITAAVAADAADRLGTVRFDVTGGAGGDPFQIWARAGPAGSMAGMVASELALSNVVNGVVVPALKLIGGDAHFAGKIHAGAGKEIIIDPTLPAIITTMGGARMAEGKLPNDNLIYWFGPRVEVSQMRKSNATEWRDSSGNAYFGGTLTAGVLITRASSSSLALLPDVETPDFTSNGGQVRVNLSYSYNGGRHTDGMNPRPSDADGVNSGQVRLYRSINGGNSWVDITSMAVSGSWSEFYVDNGTEPGQPNWLGQEMSQAGGSITFLDPLEAAGARRYRAALVTQSIKRLPLGSAIQLISIVASEG